jgi:hypothetical protein
MRISPRRIKPAKFRKKWIELQKLCASQENWPLAVIAADKLLDDALKKKHCKGKSMGERLVSAQRQLTDNDSVWYSHNLAKKLKAENSLKLRQTQVKKSLVGFGRALRDLGAINDQQTKE